MSAICVGIYYLACSIVNYHILISSIDFAACSKLVQLLSTLIFTCLSQSVSSESIDALRLSIVLFAASIDAYSCWCAWEYNKKFWLAIIRFANSSL
jgi:hypothetical protein